jgi:hypothetical protein
MPHLGRWMSRDPYALGEVVSESQTANLYSFTDNNPLARLDPDGRNPIIVILVGAGAAAAGRWAWGKMTGEPATGREIAAAAAGGAAGAGLMAWSAAAGIAATSTKGFAAAGLAGMMSTATEHAVLGKPATAGALLGGAAAGTTGVAAGAILQKIGSRLSDAAGGATRAAPELSTAAQRSIRSLESRLAEHESKLAADRENPFAFDNRGDLARNAARPEVQQRIIDGRIRHLEGEIRNFQQQLERLRSGSVEP